MDAEVGTKMGSAGTQGRAVANGTAHDGRDGLGVGGPRNRCGAKFSVFRLHIRPDDAWACGACGACPCLPQFSNGAHGHHVAIRL